METINALSSAVQALDSETPRACVALDLLHSSFLGLFLGRQRQTGLKELLQGELVRIHHTTVQAWQIDLGKLKSELKIKYSIPGTIISSRFVVSFGPPMWHDGDSTFSQCTTALQYSSMEGRWGAPGKVKNGAIG